MSLRHGETNVICFKGRLFVIGLSVLENYPSLISLSFDVGPLLLSFTLLDVYVMFTRCMHNLVKSNEKAVVAGTAEM